MIKRLRGWPVLAIAAAACLLTALMIASEIVVPLLLAILLALTLAPAVRGMIAIRIPRSVASLVVVSAALVLAAGVFYVLVEPAENIVEAYATGRGSFRLRARWHKEPLPHGLYQIAVSEIPYQVPKSRLIEKIAALLEEKKLPLLADIRDESASEVRIVLEPKNRNVDPDVLMEPWEMDPRAMPLNTSDAPYLEDPPCLDFDLSHMLTKERG